MTDENGAATVQNEVEQPVDAGADTTPVEQGATEAAEQGAVAPVAEAPNPYAGTPPPAPESAPVAQGVETPEKKRGDRKIRQGVVVSSKMQKTVVVQVVRKIRHPLYGRTVNRARKFKAHDEHNACGVGDRVEIWETRPLSKEKRWRVARILEKAR